MNKKEFIALFTCNITTLILLIEHWCGIPLALESACIWGIISLLIQIYVLRDHIKICVVEE